MQGVKKTALSELDRAGQFEGREKELEKQLLAGLMAVCQEEKEEKKRKKELS